MAAFDPDQYSALNKSANAFLKNGDFRNAVLQYRKILAGLQNATDILPSMEYEKVTVWGNLGTAYWMLRDFKHAIAAIKKAIDLGLDKQYPKSTIAKLYINLAKCYQRVRNPEEIECLKKSALFGSKEAMKILNEKGIHHLILNNTE